MIGAHHDTKDLIRGAQDIKDACGNVVQIFLTKDLKFDYHPKEDLLKYHKYLIKNKMRCVVHSSYQHNLCRDWEPQSWWIQNIIKELEYCKIIDAIGLVIHFGKYMDLTIQEAYNNMYSSLVHLHDKTKHSKTLLLLETGAGQGTQICYKMDDLAYFYKRIINSPNKGFSKRVRICLDTCHIFSAGYEIRTKEAIERYLKTFEELIGIRYIKLVHLNDSKMDIGTQIDRHESIAKGFIGFKALKMIADYFMALNVPVILETPGDSFKTEIKLFLKPSLTTINDPNYV